MPITDTFSFLKAGAETLRAADKIPEYTALLDAMGRIRELEGSLADAQADAREARNQIEVMLDNSAKIQSCVRDKEFCMMKTDILTVLAAR